MNDFTDKVTDKLTDIEFLKTAKRILFGVVIIALPILYFGYSDTLTLERLLNFSFGGLTLIVAVSTWMITSESKSWAFDNAFKSEKGGKELTDLSQSVEDNANKIIKKDRKMIRSNKWIASLNKEKQELFNEMKTQKKLSALDRRAISLRLKGKTKKADRIDKRKERYKDEGMFDKSFQPYDMGQLVETDNDTASALRKIRQKRGNAELKSNPKKVNPIIQFFSIIIKSATVGLTAVLPFILSEDPANIFRFYLTYTLALTLTFFTNYLFTSLKMGSKHKTSLKKTIELQKDLLEYLEKEEAQDERERAEIQQQASSRQSDTDNSGRDKEIAQSGKGLGEESGNADRGTTDERGTDTSDNQSDERKGDVKE